MKKLIAQRPVLYMGRSYDSGATLPADDTKMVAAWLRAGSAAWHGEKPAKKPQEDTDRSPAFSANLDVEQLEGMKKADLETLAEKMGVDISEAKNNAERAAILAAAEVQVPADSTEEENEGAQ